MTYKADITKGIYIAGKPSKDEPTWSKSSPRNSRRGCLCPNKDVYSVKCCDGRLRNQGIGKISKNA